MKNLKNACSVPGIRILKFLKLLCHWIWKYPLAVSVQHGDRMFKNMPMRNEKLIFSTFLHGKNRNNWHKIHHHSMLLPILYLHKKLLTNWEEKIVYSTKATSPKLARVDQRNKRSNKFLTSKYVKRISKYSKLEKK